MKYFSVLNTLTGKRDELIELPENANGTLLLEHLVDRYPGFVPYRNFLRLAVNLEYCDFETRLADEDEVALIPPVSGG